MFFERLTRKSSYDEFSIKSLNDSYINYVYEEIYKGMYEIAKNLLGKDPYRTLEIGAGSLSKAENYFSNIELSDGSFESKFGKKTYLVAENLPFQNETYDVILAKDALHHFSDPDRALAEISRVLKPGGLFIVSEPYWSILGRFVFRFIHPEKWNTNPADLKNLSVDPFDANQASLYCLRKSKFQDLVIENSLELKVFESTYGLSYLLSGGLNWRNRIPFPFLITLDRIERQLDCFRIFTGLNVMACFRKTD